MRSLWTSASGMSTQQDNVDVISNNLSNVNTYGFKKERMEFKTLLYDTMQRADLDEANQKGRPVNLQVGSGVKPIATARIFTQGNLERTDQTLDFAINGEGFFSVRRSPLDADQQVISYTKDGSFKTSPTEDGLMIVTSEGYPILGIDDEPIVIPPDVMLKDIMISEQGVFQYKDADGVIQDMGFQFDIIQFSNVQGLEAIGGNLFVETPASGAPIKETSGDITNLSKLVQGVLETSNVKVADEMVNLIIAQRAYELSSKAITTSDEMLQQANNVKRS